MLALHDTIVYGPVRSRRLGVSLGINVLPPGLKTCNFNCTYCQYGWTPFGHDRALPPDDVWPTPQTIGQVVSGHLRTLRDAGRRLDRITLAGDGEPTLHPRFDEVALELAAARDHEMPGTALAVLSNSSTVQRAAVRRGLELLDERYMKLDAGDAMTMKRVNASPVAIEEIIDGLASLSDVIIQSMFVNAQLARMENTSEHAVASWLEALALIDPSAVHLYTLDRSPASPCLRPASARRLREIARRVRAAGFTAIVFPPRAPSSHRRR